MTRALPKNFTVKKLTSINRLKGWPSPSRWGGKMEEYSTLRWLDKYPTRFVEVAVTLFSGVGVHYYVDIRDSGNPRWDFTNKCWGEPWSDPDPQKPQWSEKFDTEEEAQAFIRKTLIANYGKKKTIVGLKSYQNADAHRWFYKEGD